MLRTPLNTFHPDSPNKCYDRTFHAVAQIHSGECQCLIMAEEGKGVAGRCGGRWLSRGQPHSSMQAVSHGTTPGRKGHVFLSVCSSVPNICSGLLCIAFVVYRGVVGYKMGLELLGRIHNSRLKWKTSYGRLWSAGNCSSCRRTRLSQHSLKYSLMVLSNRSHASPGQD